MIVLPVFRLGLVVVIAICISVAELTSNSTVPPLLVGAGVRFRSVRYVRPTVSLTDQSPSKDSLVNSVSFTFWPESVSRKLRYLVGLAVDQYVARPTPGKSGACFLV